VVNAQQILQRHWACNALQISRWTTMQIAHFPFPSVKGLRLKGVGNILALMKNLLLVASGRGGIIFIELKLGILYLLGLMD
jgi:hypothetical protein